jgi:hypothetical protein
MLALAFYLGASTATAQAPGNSVVAMNDAGNLVITANGDMYLGTNPSGPIPTSWTRMVNVFAGGPTPAATESWGALKAKYR